MKKIMLICLLVFAFFGCATSNGTNKNDFKPSTIKIPNNIKTLGLVGRYAESDNTDVVTGIIKRNKLHITSRGEGIALLFISNNYAEIAIIYIVVSSTGNITLINTAKYTDESISTILTGTTWILNNDSGSETIRFVSGTKGLYTINESSGTSYSLNFSYRINENEISLVFVIDGIMITSGTISKNIMTLLSIDDEENQIYLEFYRLTNTEEDTNEK